MKQKQKELQEALQQSAAKNEGSRFRNIDGNGHDRYSHNSDKEHEQHMTVLAKSRKSSRYFPYA